MSKRPMVRGGDKKLSLTKETLRQLSAEQLEDVAGGSFLFCGSRVGFTCSAGPGCTGSAAVCQTTSPIFERNPLE